VADDMKDVMISADLGAISQRFLGRTQEELTNVIYKKNPK